MLGEGIVSFGVFEIVGADYFLLAGVLAGNGWETGRRLFVSRSLERIADHASNIATDVIFWIRGADVRHQLSMAMD